MVAVQNAQRVSDAPLLEKTSTVATPIEPDIFRVLARAINSLPSAGARKLTLISTVNPDFALLQPRRDRDTGGLVGQCGNHPAMEMAEKLHQVFAVRQGEFCLTGFDSDDAKACGAGKAPWR
jgi:hypothetical protein